MLEGTQPYRSIALRSTPLVYCAESAPSSTMIRRVVQPDAWLNPDGFVDRPLAGSVLSKYTLNAEAPLMFYDGETGDKYRIGLETISTDGGSIPKILQAIPWFEPRRFMRAYPNHDGIFQRGYVYICRRTDPLVFVKTEVDQAFADELLRRMIIAEGYLLEEANPQWSAFQRWRNAKRIQTVSTVVYGGLRVGGFVAWNKYRKEGRKVDPHGKP